MASASVLQKLQSRAKQAETMIQELKSQIDNLRQSAAISISKSEEDKLKQENEKLRDEISQLKVQLIMAEIRNGVRQYQIPINRSVVKCEDNSKSKEASPAAATEAKVAAEAKKAGGDNQGEKGDQKGKGEKKGKKGETKPKQSDEAEPKAKKGKSEPKVPAAEEKMDVSRLDFRIGKIVDVKKHEGADSLYVESVDLGEGRNRTVVSGLVKFVPLEQMQDRVAVFMCNLKPAKMRGVLSEAMIMCASTPEKVEILIPPAGSQIGDKVTVADYPGTPDVQLNPKKKVWETLKPDLRVDANKVATYKGAPLQVEGKGAIVSPSLADVQIQ
ncbi:hypothetical protein FSP39_024249 [Pinctada imbricata]|uniref:tRNA-binding domain-containing protein n=1 Tax=Pinctada imbricata TaxID=66713 RepID=A0AA88Y8T2_PINIB|nr:hypothetical protein FSP39_024249 [Pinctada imbricata]